MYNLFAALSDLSRSRENTPATITCLSSSRIAVRWVSAIPAPGPPPTIPTRTFLSSSVAINFPVNAFCYSGYAGNILIIIYQSPSHDTGLRAHHVSDESRHLFWLNELSHGLRRLSFIQPIFVRAMKFLLGHALTGSIHPTEQDAVASYAPSCIRVGNIFGERCQCPFRSRVRC